MSIVNIIKILLTVKYDGSAMIKIIMNLSIFLKILIKVKMIDKILIIKSYGRNIAEYKQTLFREKNKQI